MQINAIYGNKYPIKMIFRSKNYEIPSNLLIKILYLTRQCAYLTQ